MLVAIGLVYMIMVILVSSLLVTVVILCARPLAIVGAFVALTVTGRATNIVTGLAVSFQDAVLPATVITAGMWIAYSVGDGIAGVAHSPTRRLVPHPPCGQYSCQPHLR
jgi:Na+/H+-translocating membrane pyrophosphatase